MKRFKLFLSLIIGLPFTVALMMILLFLPAGSLYWINGWIFIISIACYVILTFIYFYLRDPSTLERRSRMTADEGASFFFIIVAILFLALLIIPALDYRFAWSQLPTALPLIGLLGLIISYMILFLVMRANSFASKGLIIHDGHKVMDEGPYAIVRHPMYTGFILMAICIPVTLGSLPGIIPAAFIPFLLAWRIHREEKMLLKELKNYETYRQKVKYRLIPRIW